MEIKRSISSSLLTWKDSSTRRPLIVRGARQIGKSFIIRSFGKTFDSLIELNLEEHKDIKQLFESNNPSAIISALALQFNQAIVPGKTLLFIDEIQESSAALLALRYFYEKMPEMHVVCAGSLFDVALDKDKALRMPVGRIEYLYMYPLSFMEFLNALGEHIAFATVQGLSLNQHLDELSHKKLLTLFNQYILCGGMPAVVEAFANFPADLRYRKLQADILKTYVIDFRKYRTRIDYEKLEVTFKSLARFACKDFMYNEICPTFTQATTKNILGLFEMAKVINRITCTYANGTPLNSEINARGYKYALLDVGLYNSFSGLTIEDIHRWNYDLVNAGSIAEQAVAQELLAYSDANFEAQLYYWQRAHKGSSAEVDYIISLAQNIIPLEVKSGTTGRLISLRNFMKEKKSAIGIRVSQHPLSLHDKVLSIPIYALSQLSRLVQEALV